MTNFTKPNTSLTEDEIFFVKETYASGVTNPTSIVAKLYSKGNEIPFTPLKKIVNKLLNITETFKSISDVAEVPVVVSE